MFKRGLEVDDLSEELYQGFLVYYLNLGQKAKALSVYNHWRKTTSSTFGIGPSAKTRAIYRQSLLQ